jgi:hypothetical protein
MSPVQGIPNLTPVPVTANVKPVGKDKSRGQYRSPEKEKEEVQAFAPAEPESSSPSPQPSGPAGSPDLDNPEKRGQIIDVKA